jgi:glyoxylase-like metal-dependent hydrolase (beta-lactamase superfamily II)
MFGIIPKAIWSKWTKPDEQNRIPLQTNCLLLDDGSQKVLIETGCGGKFSEKERAIYALEERTIVDALGEVNVKPEEISTVIVTHLHFDHAGGLTRLKESGEPACVFPSAEVVVQRQEWEDAMANKSTMSKTYLSSHLEPIRESVRPVDGIVEVIPGIRVEPLVGHTWGMQGVFFQDDDGEIAFPADLMPTAAHVHPAASMGYDMLPYETMRTKQAFLDRAAAAGWRILLGHEPGEPLFSYDGDALKGTSPGQRA